MVRSESTSGENVQWGEAEGRGSGQHSTGEDHGWVWLALRDEKQMGNQLRLGLAHLLMLETSQGHQGTKVDSSGVMQSDL